MKCDGIVIKVYFLYVFCFDHKIIVIKLDKNGLVRLSIDFNFDGYKTDIYRI